MNRIFEVLKKYKYIVIALAAGIVLLLLPRTASGQARDAPVSPTTAQLYGGSGGSGYSDEEKLSAILAKLDGAEGLAIVLSDRGAVVICRNLTPELKLRITQAVSVYTGLSSEKIIILKGA
ncbi:MAG: hypothetical protein LBC38_00535 [Oscillospiraceae bacterium]|jgi:hypothetical protein|nr:hypothetical protein [Oscillospiraceae bacterium]